ncbi:MAG: hypothetical protein Tsb0027_00460 [Wenzhouxiangellaceae bacterium]
MLDKIKTLFAVSLMLIASSASAFWVNEQFDGQWVEVGNSDARRGFNMQFIRTGPGDTGVIFITAFVNLDGEDIWLSGNATGVSPGDDTFNVPMALVSGGNFFGGPDGSVGATAIADFTFTVNSCDSIDVSWSSTGAPDVGSGSASFDRGSSSLGDVLAVGRDQCVYQEAPQGCPAFATQLNGRFCGLTGTFENQDITLSNSYVWVLNGPVFFGGPDNTGPSTVTIEPGTYLVGSTGQDAFIIRRGSKVIADGNRNAPIVFTSSSDLFDDDDVTPAPGDFGGFAIFGNAPSNACTTTPDPCDAAFEGLPGEEFGGNDADDSSGIVRFVQVRYAGNPIVQDQELNALTVSGVGAGTIFEYIQIHAGLDDGIEVFSGDADFRYLVFTNVVDDNFDIDLGAKVNAQYGLIVQGPLSNDSAYELDNNPNNNSAEPRTEINLANFTSIGVETAGGNGLHFRTGVGFKGYNLFITNAGDECVDLDDDETFNNAGTPGNLTGNLTVEGSALGSCFGGNFEEGDGDAFSTADWWNSQGNLTGVDPEFVAGTAFPSAGSVLQTGSSVVPPGDFFNRETHIGAFRDQNDRWTDGWTFELDQAIQAALGQ